MDSGSVGMLARLHDEAQLAAVLAHEINHVAGHHGIVDYRATRKKTIAGMVLGGLGGWGDLISIGLHASVYGFARDLEQEADDHAGRAPRAARARRRLASHGCARAARSRRAVVDTNALVDESTRLGALFATKLQAIMETKGYTVEVIDPQRINADPKLQEYVLDANRRFDEMRSRVRPRRIKRRIYNAGDEVRLLADYLGVDAIAFSHVNITITPAGKAIVSALIGGATAGAYASVALVDGNSGDLEAMFNSIDVGLPGDKTTEELQEQVDLLAERAVDSLPAADPSKRVEAASEEDVLSDIESLLNE